MDISFRYGVELTEDEAGRGPYITCLGSTEKSFLSPVSLPLLSLSLALSLFLRYCLSFFLVEVQRIASMEQEQQIAALVPALAQCPSCLTPCWRCVFSVVQLNHSFATSSDQVNKMPQESNEQFQQFFLQLQASLETGRLLRWQRLAVGLRVSSWSPRLCGCEADWKMVPQTKSVSQLSTTQEGSGDCTSQPRPLRHLP